jgi:hypothetical protein
MDVSHTLDSSGWKTELRGLMRIDYGFGAKKPVANILKDMLQKQADIVNDDDPNTNPNDPPYLNFVDYLTKTKGRKSPFRLDPNPPKEINEEDKLTSGVKKAEAGQGQ